MADRNEYMTMKEAAMRLKVERGTLYYYIKQMGLETKKFPLDKHKYLKVADVERIKSLKDEAAERANQKSEEAA